MSKKDKLKEEIANLREKRKDIFSILFALFSGLAIVVYAIVSGEKPIYTMYLVILGTLIVVSLAIYYKKIDEQVDDKIEALEKEE